MAFYSAETTRPYPKEVSLEKTLRTSLYIQFIYLFFKTITKTKNKKKIYVVEGNNVLKTKQHITSY